MPIPTFFGPSHKERKLRNIFRLLQQGRSKQHSDMLVRGESPQKRHKGHRTTRCNREAPQMLVIFGLIPGKDKVGCAALQPPHLAHLQETLQLNRVRVWGKKTEFFTHVEFNTTIQSLPKYAVYLSTACQKNFVPHSPPSMHSLTGTMRQPKAPHGNGVP